MLYVTKLSVIMLNDFKLSVTMLNITKLSVIMMSGIMLIKFRLNGGVLNVIEALKTLYKEYILKHEDNVLNNFLTQRLKLVW